MCICKCMYTQTPNCREGLSVVSVMYQLWGKWDLVQGHLKELFLTEDDYICVCDPTRCWGFFVFLWFSLEAV